MSESEKIKVSVAELTSEWLVRLVSHTSNVECGLVFADPGIVPELKKVSNKKIFSSREMEIALANHIHLKENFNEELDKFFIENYPKTFENAMKLAFYYYLGGDDNIYEPPASHLHFQSLLDLIKEKPDFSKFYEICNHLKKDFDAFIDNAEKKWQSIEDVVSFEKAVATVAWLHYKFIISNDTSAIPIEPLLHKNSFLIAAETYLTRVKKDCKPNYKLWTSEIMRNNINDLIGKDFDLLKKIDIYIQNTILLQKFRRENCDVFIFYKTAEFDLKKKSLKYSRIDDILCNIKNKILPFYFVPGNALKLIHPPREEIDISILNNRIANAYNSLLTDYFAIKEDNLQEILIENEELNSDCWDIIYSAEKAGTNVMTWPVMVKKLSNNLRFLCMDVSADKTQNFEIYNTLCHKESDTCIIFPYMRKTSEPGYIAPLNRFKRNGSKAKLKEWGERTEEIIVQRFKENSIFANANISKGKPFYNEKKEPKGDIDVAVYKDKTLILIEVKSTYQIISPNERLRNEKCLLWAGCQLDKAINALKTDAKLLADITEDGIKFEDLKIIKPMIISTSFEFDNQEFQEHKKLSLLELMVILRNDAIKLILPSPEIKNRIKKLQSDKEFRETIIENNVKEWKKTHPCFNPEELHDLLEFALGLKPNSVLTDAEFKELLLYKTENPSVEDFLKALDSNFWEKILPYWREDIEYLVHDYKSPRRIVS